MNSYTKNPGAVNAQMCQQAFTLRLSQEEINQTSRGRSHLLGQVDPLLTRV